MASTRFYPQITSVIKTESLPKELGFIQDGIAALLNDVYLKDIQFVKSNTGDSVSYLLILKIYKRLGIDIPGTGFSLLLNPPRIGDPDPNSSEVQMSVNYQLELLKEIPDFSLDSFSFMPSDFFNLLVDFLDTLDEELIDESIKQFNSTNTVNGFVDDLNTYYTLTIPNDIQYPVNTNRIEAILEVINSANFIALNVTPTLVVFAVYLLDVNSIENTEENINRLFSLFIGTNPIGKLKELIVPKINAAIKLSPALEVPRNVLIPVKATGEIETDENIKMRFDFDLGEFTFSTEGGIGFDEFVTVTFPAQYPKAQIGNTGLKFGFTNAKLDFSRETNIPEATADGRPNDFIGVFIQQAEIDLPAKWFKNPNGATAEIFGERLLIGTGGISGKIGLRASLTTPPLPNTDPVFPLIGDPNDTNGAFFLGFKQFDITLQQNSIVGCEISGELRIPGFKDGDGNPAMIEIVASFDKNGELNVVASVTNTLTVIKIPDVFSFDIKSIFVGKNADGRFYIGCSGAIDFLLQEPIGQFLPDKVDIKKLIIYDDGNYEFEGGSICLPKAFELKIGTAKIGVTAIHLGSYEKDDRKYKYFGFDGGVSTNPSGVDARGKGIKYYYTTDGGPFKWFLRLESLEVDIIIPGGAKPEDAAVIIKGFLSLKDPKIPTGTPEPLYTILKNATEYAGGVYVSIPKFKGLEVSATMSLIPQVPAFIIDLGVQISTPILLGTTGLGIYGFRAIFGKRYVASKTAAGLPEDGEWWQYYKAKIDPDYKEGIQISKFLVKEGFSVGAGVSLATSSDSGKTFSSKLFFMLSLPDVFLFQGQAQFLKDRIGLDAVPDPPFFAIIAITKHSIECGFGINYKMPENTGKLVTVDGITELGFFFGDSSAWYLNIGRETPDSMRIQARVFDILNMYFYFMISNSGIRAGAGVSFEWKKKFGPLSAELSAYLDAKGKISNRPRQIGGAIQVGGTVALKICGFGFSVSGGATLASEAPKPHIITGEFEVCVRVLKKDRCARFEFTWNFDHDLNLIRNPVLVDVIEGSSTSNLNDLSKVAKANHMVTGETLNLAACVLNDGDNYSNPAIPVPSVWIDGHGADDFRVPVDSFIDIEFKKGLNVSPLVSPAGNLDKIGGMSAPCEYIEYVPPQKGKSDRVRHEYYFDSIEIKYWDENTDSWEDYNFYDALVPMFPGTEQVGTLIDPTTLANLKWGYWQQQRPGYNNKLRILATTPLSYTANNNSLIVEDLGIDGETIFCPGTAIPKTCVIFEKDQIYHTYPGTELNTYKGILFKITNEDCIVLNTSYLGIANGLFVQPGNTIEMFFSEPMKFVNLIINSGAPGITISYYTRTAVLEIDGSQVLSGGLPVFQYDLIESKNYTSPDWGHEIAYTNTSKNIDYIKITTISCYEKPDQPRNIICLKADEQIVIRLRDMQNFITTLIRNKHFTAQAVQLNPKYASIYTGVYMGTSLYPNQNYKENIINLTQGYISANTLLFTISDNLGFNCNYSFELVKPESGFNFANIESIVSITPYTTGATAGMNYYFLLKVKVNINGVGKEIEILGKSCLPMAYCYDRCSTALYRVCYLSYADYLLNQTIPTGATQGANNQTLLDGINKTLQPIWRPNTTFAIRIKTTDKIFRESETSPIAGAGPFYLDVVYGFKTAGPVGHYHNYPVNNIPATQQVRQDFLQLDNADRPDDFKLLSLKYYIDYTKSYPNADGDIINAKPLFYIGAELRLFYLYNYVYEFFNDWVDTNPAASNPYIAKSALEVIVRDPEDTGIPEINPALNFVGNSISHIDNSGIDLPPNNINNINNDVIILNNMLLNGNPCAAYTPLAPIDISTKKTLDLKPLKAYTAQFIARYNPLIGEQYAEDDYKTLVHTYVFQTSRYRNFEEQVNSYILKKDSYGFILKEAVFVTEAEKAGTPTAQLDLGLAANVITNNELAIPDAIKLQYADQFDRLINGVLHIDYNKLQAPTTTEFNLIKHPDTNAIIGILIRNPEPFNDPKLPKANPNISSAEATETLEVAKWNGSSWDDAYDNYVIHSKDRSRIFVTNRNFNFNIDPYAKLKFTFRYKLFNGVEYCDVSVIDVEINLSTYSS